MPFLKRKLQLSQEITSVLNSPEIDAELILSEFSIPPSTAAGHLALPCFRLAKLLSKANHQLALELATRLNSDTLEAKAMGPYCNFRWKSGAFFDELSSLVQASAPLASDTLGKGKRVLLEYCSPNVAKKLGIHHVRSTLIGNTLANVYDHLGYETCRINFIGDWGTQFARLLSGFNLWGNPEQLTQSDPNLAMKHLDEIYTRYHREIENDSQYVELAGKALKLLEAGDPQQKEVWKKIREISVRTMEKTLQRLQVQFDKTEGESDYIEKISGVIDQVKKLAQARMSEGAWVVDIEGIETPALIQKTDGTTLYLTRDIAAAISRAQRLPFERSLYIVSSQQTLHFQHLFGTLKKMGFDWADRCEHIPFGTVLIGSVKMSTRKGTAVLLDDILVQAKTLALEECTKKNPDLASKSEVAEMVGTAAIIFGEFSSHRTRDIEFDWKAALSFDGETGPYVQYSLVRCGSLVNKAREHQLEPVKIAGSYGFSLEEESLILTLASLRNTLHQVVRENDPFYLAKYLIEVAKAFNRFYYKHPVLQANESQQREVRLQLVLLTQKVLSTGLNLMGIRCPEEM